MVRARVWIALSLAGLACSPAPDVGSSGGGGGSGGAGGSAGSTGGSGGDAGGGVAGGQGGGGAVRRITRLELTPPRQSLQVSESAAITCTATFDDGSTADVSGSVNWSALPAGLVDVRVTSVDENKVRVTALATGTASVTAQTGTVTSTPAEFTVSGAVDAGSMRPEVRAVWVTRFAFANANPATAKAAITRIMTEAARGGFNVVYFQIRGTADAYYRSNLVPWAKGLTGTLGKDPGWDPLQFAIDEAHSRGLELHAYFNAFSGWPTPAGCAAAGTCACTPTQGQADSCALPEASFPGAPEHFLRAHPEAIAVDATGRSVDTEYYWVSGGNTAYRAHLIAVASELLTRYAVDGLHLDRIRYPGPWASRDAESEATYAALPAPKPSRDDWQRDNITAAVAGIYATLKAQRPTAVLSASVWGIYKRLPGCSTSEGYPQYFQDSVGWLKAGKIDAITPMIYWDIGSGCTDWARLLDGFVAEAAGRPVIAGMHVLDNGAPRPDRMSARVAYARRAGAAGVSLFASAYLDQPPAGGSGASWSSLRADGGVFATDAGTPPINWR